MKYKIAASIMRKLPAETAHRITIKALSTGAGPVFKRKQRLETKIAGLTLPNPIGMAAGFDKNAEAADALFRAGFGFVECGTVTPLPQAGNPKPRIFRLKEDDAIINAMGFNNVGLHDFVDHLRKRAHLPGIIGANVGANKDSENKINDYALGVRRVWLHSSYITMNISSPNTKGLRDLQGAGALEDLLGTVNEVRDIQTKTHGHRPLFLKVAPDLDEKQIADIARLVKWAKINALIVSNTTIDRPETLKNPNKTRPGGLSGRPLFEKSTEVLKAFKSELGDEIDLIGVGGIMSGEDAVKKLEAGAKAIQIYTGFIYRSMDLMYEIEQAIADYRGIK